MSKGDLIPSFGIHPIAEPSLQLLMVNSRYSRFIPSTTMIQIPANSWRPMQLAFANSSPVRPSGIYGKAASFRFIQSPSGHGMPSWQTVFSAVPPS
jgi:hypothetical protein